MKAVVRNTLRALVIAGASLSMVNAAQAQWRGGHGHYHGGYGHRGGGWGGAPWVFGGLGLGLGIGLASAYAWPWYGYAAPTYVYSPPPTVVYSQPVPAAPVYATPVQPVYTAPVPSASTVAPVIYPRNGQTDAQREADADACSQWAGRQPNATADRSVFTRGITACMDARGYTLR